MYIHSLYKVIHFKTHIVFSLIFVALIHTLFFGRGGHLLLFVDFVKEVRDSH